MGNLDLPSAETHFNKLTPAEAEALALLAEECGELVQIISKILRHGINSYHPDSGDSNRKLLTREAGDVLAAMRIAEIQNLLPWARVIEARDAKMKRVQEYLHHAEVWPHE